MPTFSLPLPDEAATERLGATLAARLRPRDVVALVGGLGAGKTTLARAVLRAASGQPAMVVPSPTFTLVEVYDTPRGVFWHFDLYRLEQPEQVFELFFDLLARTFVLNLDHLLTREQYCKTVWP